MLEFTLETIRSKSTLRKVQIHFLESFHLFTCINLFFSEILTTFTHIFGILADDFEVCGRGWAQHEITLLVFLIFC